MNWIKTLHMDMVSQNTSCATWGSRKEDHTLIHCVLCINKLDEVVNMVVKQGLDGPKLIQELFFILLYAYDVFISIYFRYYATLTFCIRKVL